MKEGEREEGEERFMRSVDAGTLRLRENLYILFIFL